MRVSVRDEHTSRQTDRVQQRCPSICQRQQDSVDIGLYYFFSGGLLSLSTWSLGGRSPLALLQFPSILSYYILPASASDPCWEGRDLTMTSGFEFLLFPVGSDNWVVYTRPTAKLGKTKCVKFSYRSVILYHRSTTVDSMSYVLMDPYFPRYVIAFSTSVLRCCKTRVACGTQE